MDRDIGRLDIIATSHKIQNKNQICLCRDMNRCGVYKLQCRGVSFCKRMGWGIVVTIIDYLGKSGGECQGGG